MKVLTPEEALEIYARSHAGESQVEIAKAFVVSQGTVSGIKRGYYWNKVTGHQRTRPLSRNQQRNMDIYSAYWDHKIPVPEIAATYGLSLTSVYDIRNGKTGSGYTGHPNPKLRRQPKHAA